MKISGNVDPAICRADFSAVREFNRFYTARLGLLRRRHLDGELSLTEARILYEIGARPKMRASDLCGILELDAGYISRILSALAKRKLVRQAASESDGREKLLMLTATGAKAVRHLNDQSTRQIEGILSSVDTADREAMVASLARVRSILLGRERQLVRIVRLTTANEEAIRILEEVLRSSPRGAAGHVGRHSTASQCGRFGNVASLHGR